MALVEYKVQDGVAILELNNPPANAYTLESLKQLDEVIIKARFDATAHVLVIGERSHAAQLRRLASTLERLVTDVRGIWPERTWNGRMQPFKPGIQLVLRRVPVPIVPVGVAGAFESYPRTSLLPRPSPLFWAPTGHGLACSCHLDRRPSS